MICRWKLYYYAVDLEDLCIARKWGSSSELWDCGKLKIIVLFCCLIWYKWYASIFLQSHTLVGWLMKETWQTCQCLLDMFHFVKWPSSTRSVLFCHPSECNIWQGRGGGSGFIKVGTEWQHCLVVILEERYSKRKVSLTEEAK